MQNFFLNQDWKQLLQDEFQKDYYQNLLTFLQKEYKTKTIYPPEKDVFSALNLTPFKEVKVVIIGQDPYHNKNQAHGLSFSVQKGVKLPPSLRNIYKELNSDLNIPISSTGYLISWAKQGVLMINSVLTVQEKTPNSHKNKGWEQLTDRIIKLISDKKLHVVFILWGKFAQTKKHLIDSKKHLIIESNHPSPFSAHKGFFGSKPFSKTNKYLEQHNIKPIDWIITS